MKNIKEFIENFVVGLLVSLKYIFVIIFLCIFSYGAYIDFPYSIIGIMIGIAMVSELILCGSIYMLIIDWLDRKNA